MNTYDKIRIGIIGFGVVGQRRFKLLNEHPNYEVVAICEQEELSVLQEISLPVYKNFHELLNGSLDAVVVSTPNNASSKIVIYSLTKGLHVFCEKPPARNLEEIKAVVNEEQKHPSLKLKYGFNHRYHEAIKEAKSIIDSKRLGNVLSLKGTYGKSGGKNFDAIWRTKRSIAGGGILLDQGIQRE